MSLSPTEILERITQTGGRIQVDGNELDIECKKSLLDTLLPEIRANKPALMELLKSTPPPATSTPLETYLTDLAQRGFDLVHIPTLRQLHGDKAVTALLATGNYEVTGDSIKLPATTAPAQTDSARVATADHVLNQIEQAGGVMLTKSFTKDEREILAWLDQHEIVRIAMGRVWLVSTNNVALTAQACLIQLSRWRRDGFSEVSYRG